MENVKTTIWQIIGVALGRKLAVLMKTINV